jgi:hypothetical protein
MTTPERLMEREIERGTDGRTLILLACGCAKVAVMSSAKEDRQPWANWLAWCQWTEEEMRRGLPWMSLIESYDDWTENPKYNELRIR